MWICINMQKIRLFSRFALKMWLIKKSYWLRTFWPVSQKLEFSQIWYLCSNTANNINFHYRTNPVKTNDKIFQYIQQTLFLPIFPILGAKKFFLDNPGLSCATSYRFLASCQNLEKNNDTIPRQRSDRQKERRKDGQTLFYRTLPANARGPKILCYLQE